MMDSEIRRLEREAERDPKAAKRLRELRARMDDRAAARARVIEEVAKRQFPSITSNPALLKPGVGYLRGTTDAEKELLKDLKSDDVADAVPLRTQFDR